MDIKVVKFGGSSLADAEHFRQVAAIVRADPTLAVQALVNLVNNAVAHTPAGSRVTVRAEREGAQVSITVADDGPGIPDAEKGRVFEALHTSGSGWLRK